MLLPRLVARSPAVRVALSRRLSAASAPKPSSAPAAGQAIDPKKAAAFAGAGLSVLLLASLSSSKPAKDTKVDSHKAEESKSPAAEAPVTPAVVDDSKEVLELVAKINSRIDQLEKQIEAHNNSIQDQAIIDRLLRDVIQFQQQLSQIDERASSSSSSEPDQKQSEKATAALAKDELINKAKATNRAFIFVKPHAMTPGVETLVREGLAKHGMKVLNEGKLSAEEIDAKKLIDKHYYAIASKSVLLQPRELNVPEKGKKAFEERFGLSWESALEKGQVLNALAAMKLFGVDGDALEKRLRAVDKKDMIKFGGGFYCARMAPDVYVINAFYPQMREKYTTPPASLKWFEIEFDPSKLSWKDFREKFLGATDPAKAAEGSLRRLVHDNWEALGLKAKPDTGDNSLHGSASPFEALSEVANWEDKPLEEDVFGRALLAATGLDEETLRLWLSDAQVPVGGVPTSIFDALEDRDSGDVIDKLVEIVQGLKAKVVA